MCVCISWRREWQPTPLFLHGKFHGQRSLVGHSPWGHKESDMTERLSAHRHTHTPTYISFGLITWYEQRRQWHPTPALLPGKSRGQRSLVGCSPWGHKESDTTERLHFHFSLSCTGEGTGNPLQCSCLENPRVRGAGWAAVHGVAQSWTRLKRLSSSSSSSTVQGDLSSLTRDQTYTPCSGNTES